MVQEFMILRCFSCTTFQVHQVKKSKKWVCKVCGEKQSIKKVYAQGSGQDCRKHVQKLNMKCREAQVTEDLTYDNDDNNEYCHVSESTLNAVTVEICNSTTCEDHIKHDTGESKWEKFMSKTSTSSDDNGAERFDGLNVTTERDAFDKASKIGKRKWVRQDGNSNTYNKQKRSKDKDNHDIDASDVNSMNTKNVTANTQLTDVRYFSRFSSDPRMQALSTHTLESDGMTAEEQCAKSQTSGSRWLPCGNLQENQQISQYKCNVYFARATRDPPVTKLSSSVGNQEKGISTSSKWAKFMSSSSSQTKSPETTEANNCQATFMLSEYLDKTTSSQQFGVISQDPGPGCNSVSYSASDNKAKSLRVEDLLKVDDDLDDEWWNSL